MTLAEVQITVVCQHLQRVSPLQQLDQFLLNFICALLAKEERKFIYIRPGYMTKMAAMPIYDKNLKDSSSAEPMS